MATQATSSFGHLINAILLEKHGNILSKYKKQTPKKVRQALAEYESKKAAKRRGKIRKRMKDSCHIWPDITRNARKEKIMKKACTFGVVALFRAVAKHQSEIQKSFDSLDVESDPLQRRAMQIEHRSTEKFLSKLNSSSSNQKEQIQIIETPNPYKKRKLNPIDSDSEDDKEEDDMEDDTLYEHVNNMFMPTNDNELDSEDDNLDEDEDDDIKSQSEQWSVLNENMITDAHLANTKQDIMDQDSEFEDESD